MNVSNIFLEQSYKDCNESLKKSIELHKYQQWDYIVLTASCKAQAENYRIQIDRRLRRRMLDDRTTYLVVPDVEDKRIGSGGATLNVLRVLRDDYGVDFDKQRVLLIHSGGDSKRIPQYSAVGKLFSAVPREIQRQVGATLFDELIASSSVMAARIQNGVMLMSGDVTLLYNPLQVEYNGGMCAVSTKEDVEKGKNHGVFLTDEDGQVTEFLHKKSVEELDRKGALDQNRNVNIDTGILIFDGDIAKRLVNLISTAGKTDWAKFSQFVNEKDRLNFYGDFLYPFSTCATLENYWKETPEVAFSETLQRCRTAIWEEFHTETMRVESVSPAEFLHFGTTREVLNLMTRDVERYASFGWTKSCYSNFSDETNAFYQSYLENCRFTKGSFIENSSLTACEIGEGSIVSFMEAQNVRIPGNCALSGVKLENGKFVVRIYGVDDNPKSGLVKAWFAHCPQSRSRIQGIAPGAENETLWTAKVFPVRDTMRDAVQDALKTYALFVQGETSLADWWRGAEKVSFAESFALADSCWLDSFTEGLQKEISLAKIVELFRKKSTFEEYSSAVSKEELFGRYEEISARLEDDLEAQSRLNYLAFLMSEDAEHQNIYEERAFSLISKECAQSFGEKYCSAFVKDKVEVALPVRVNWGGGWSDTPPYCVEQGGTVLNAAVTINGRKPIIARVEKLKEHKIVLESADAKIVREMTDRDTILHCKDPFDAVALQKSALVSFGIVDEASDKDLKNVFKKLGGGLKLQTEAIRIPRGSGLGTSSILSAACIKALSIALGQNLTENEISAKVLYMEQQMSTGGGWQDQIGGLYDGVKMIKSGKGAQNPVVQVLTIPEEAKEELRKRFALIYTGQRRLARNLLREIVGRYLMSEPHALTALSNIEEIACLMQRALEKGDVEQFSELLNRHWEYSKLLDVGTTNTCIDFIFESVADLIDGKMICGAGGGGFLQVVLKNGADRASLERRLFDVFGDCGVKVYQTEILF